MAGPKKVDIKIAATGGEQAAAEITKPTKAIKDQSQALDANVAATNRVTASTGKMRSGVQNAAFQFQDMAVQLEMGTDASRVFSQQVPQLLGGFGAVGAVAGAVVGIGLPLAAALFKAGDAAAQSGASAEKAAEQLEKLTDARAKKVAEQAAQESASFIAALDDETIAYKRQNDEIQRTINLMQAKRIAQAEVDSANAALELIKIDASDAPEDEKIRQRAKVQEGLTRKRFEDRKAQAGERVNEAFNKATGATGDATLARSAEDAVKQRLAEQKAEEAALKKKVQASDRLASEDEAVKQAELRLATAKTAAPGLGQSAAGGIKASPAEIKKLQDRLNAAKAQRDSTVAQAGATNADRKRLETLQGPDGNSALQKMTTDLERAALALEETARTAREDYENKREIETTKLSGDFEVTKRQLEGGKIQSDSDAKKASDRIKEETDRKAADDERDRLRRAADAQQEALNADATKKARSMQTTGGRELNATYKTVEDALMDGTNAAELAKLGNDIRNAAAANGAVTTSFLMEVINSFNAQAAQIEQLRKKLKIQ